MAWGDLCTLPEVKAWLSTGGMPGTQGGYPPNDDALIVRLITACSGIFRTYLKRDIVQQDWQETRDGPPNYPIRSESKFQFGAFPVTSVALVLVRGTNVPPVPIAAIPPIGQTLPTPLTSAAGFVFSPTQLTIQGYYVPPIAQCVTIIYTAGFAVIPDEIRQACIEMVGRKVKGRQRIAERSMNLAGQSVTYDPVTIQRKDLTSDIQLVLDGYKAVAPITGYLARAQTQTDTATLVAAAA